MRPSRALRFLGTHTGCHPMLFLARLAVIFTLMLATFANASATEKPFLHQGIAADAKRYEAYLKANWKPTARRRRRSNRKRRKFSRPIPVPRLEISPTPLRQMKRIPLLGPVSPKRCLRLSLIPKAASATTFRFTPPALPIAGYQRATDDATKAPRALCSWSYPRSPLILAPGNRRVESEPHARRRSDNARDV